MKKQHIKLTESDSKFLKELLSKGEIKARQMKRIIGLQMLDKGMSYQAVKEHVGVTNVTLSKWANLYKESGLDFLKDKPRSGRPIGLSGEERAKVTALACTEPPQGYCRWSLRLLSDRLVELEILDKISYGTVSNILKKTNFSLIEKNNGVSEH